MYYVYLAVFGRKSLRRNRRESGSPQLHLWDRIWAYSKLKIRKTLEDTNLKPGDVVSDVMGKVAQMILHAVVNGESDPGRLAAFAVGRVRASQETLQRALTGKVTVHHRFLLGEHLTQIENLDEAIRRVSEEIARRFTPPEPPTQDGDEENQPEAPHASESDEPARSAGKSAPLSWQEAVEVIDQITGISQRVAEGLLTEIGVNMQQFPSVDDSNAWAIKSNSSQLLKLDNSPLEPAGRTFSEE